MKEIARRLAVLRSSVSRWVRDVELTPEQKQRLRAHDRGDRLGVARRKSERARERRGEWQAEGRARARGKGRIHLAGCMLYWAEGSRSRNSVLFTNSDPAMVRFFLDFLVDELGVQRESVRVDVNLFADRQTEGDRGSLAQFARAPGDLPAGVDCQRVLALLLEEAHQSPSVRHVPPLPSFDARRAAHLRSDSGVRRLRQTRLARLTSWSHTGCISSCRSTATGRAAIDGPAVGLLGEAPPTGAELGSSG